MSQAWTKCRDKGGKALLFVYFTLLSQMEICLFHRTFTDRWQKEKGKDEQMLLLKIILNHSLSFTLKSEFPFEIHIFFDTKSWCLNLVLSFKNDCDCRLVL